MASSNIALITKYSTEAFDKVYAAESCSSVLDKNGNGRVQWTGAKTVKIAKLAFGGLNNYYRNNKGDERVTYGGAGNEVDPLGVDGDAPYYGNGYRNSSTALTWQERTVSMDRAAKYTIEKFDDEESGGLLVGNAVSEITRVTMIPEIDAYTFSTIFQNAGHVEDGKLTITNPAGVKVEAPLGALNAAFTYLEKNEVTADEQIIFVSADFMNSLRNSAEIFKTLGQLDYDKNVKFRMTTYEGRKLVVVPPNRFQTKFDFYDNNGYGPAAGARSIDFIVMSTEAAIHVVRYNKIRVLTDEQALIATNMDGYAVYARIYHDVFVFDNKRVGIYAHVGWFDHDEVKDMSFIKLAVALTMKSTRTEGKAEITSEIAIPGNNIFTVLNHVGSGLITVGTTKVAATAGDNTLALSEFVPVKVGDVVGSTLTDVKKLYVVNEAGLVICGFGKGLSVSLDGKLVTE